MHYKYHNTYHCIYLYALDSVYVMVRFTNFGDVIKTEFKLVHGLCVKIFLLSFCTIEILLDLSISVLSLHGVKGTNY